MFKRIGLVVLVLFVLIQFYRPDRNLSGNKEKDISVAYAVPENVQQILTKACNDCHSNTTAYPWYANVQPLTLWIDDHVKDGKRHMNFNEFAGYRIAKQYKKLEECMDEVKEGEMPLESYTLIHSNAKLTADEKEAIYNWCTSVRDTIKARYPADSLIIKKKGQEEKRVQEEKSVQEEGKIEANEKQ